MNSRPTIRILDAIEWCKLENGWTDTRFGREFCGDPHFLRDLRNGKPGRKIDGPRCLRPKKRQELVEFLDKHTTAKSFTGE